jgi:hypothetical protein
MFIFKINIAGITPLMQQTVMVKAKISTAKKGETSSKKF